MDSLQLSASSPAHPSQCPSRQQWPSVPAGPTGAPSLHHDEGTFGTTPPTSAELHISCSCFRPPVPINAPRFSLRRHLPLQVWSFPLYKLAQRCERECFRWLPWCLTRCPPCWCWGWAAHPARPGPRAPCSILSNELLARQPTGTFCFPSLVIPMYVKWKYFFTL